MRFDRLDRMVRGWIIGDFDPAVIRARDFEFGIKNYKAGDAEVLHYHKAATEVTVIVSGKAAMNGHVLGAGDIVVLEPGDGSDFSCISDVTLAVIKMPSVAGDKYTERELNA
jgi:hypothetical protein